MSSSLLLQQCPVCLVRLTFIVFVMSGSSNFYSFRGRTAASLWGATSRTCSILLAAFLCNYHEAFSPSV